MIPLKSVFCHYRVHMYSTFLAVIVFIACNDSLWEIRGFWWEVNRGNSLLPIFQVENH